MTTLTEARTAIYTRWIANWLEADAKYHFDNEEFIKPTNLPWLRVSVRHRDSNQDTLGRKPNRKYKRDGSILINIFTVPGKGTKVSDSLVQSARTIFEGETFSGVTVDDVSNREIGLTDDKWYMVVVEAFFSYYETK